MRIHQRRPSVTIQPQRFSAKTRRPIVHQPFKHDIPSKQSLVDRKIKPKIIGKKLENHPAAHNFRSLPGRTQDRTKNLSKTIQTNIHFKKNKEEQPNVIIRNDPIIQAYFNTSIFINELSYEETKILHQLISIAKESKRYEKTYCTSREKEFLWKVNFFINFGLRISDHNFKLKEINC